MAIFDFYISIPESKIIELQIRAFKYAERCFLENACTANFTRIRNMYFYQITNLIYPIFSPPAVKLYTVWPNRQVYLPFLLYMFCFAAHFLFRYELPRFCYTTWIIYIFTIRFRLQYMLLPGTEFDSNKA